MAKRPDETPRYAISIAAAMVESHPQTLRMYERSGLVEPSRSDGNVRLYSEGDILRIKRIQSYTQMGVNLAGIDIIFRLLQRIEELERQVEGEPGDDSARREAEATERLRARLRKDDER